MNLFVIAYVLGQVCRFEAAFMLLPMGCALCYGEYSVALVYFLCALLCLGVGFFLTLRKPDNLRIRPKEGMAATALSWVVISVLGCLPFLMTGEIASFADAFFETVSGFTTTGSSILTDLDAMSYGSRFWRSFTHWIGGMGVLVFILAILPSTSSSFMNLMVAESPGPSVSKLVPTLRETAKYLYGIYLGLSIIQVVLLLLAGMPLFDSLTLTMGTAGTGGFSVRSSGFADYTMLQQAIIGVFMMLFGINFSFYFLLIRRKFKSAFRMEEVLTYLAIIFTVVILIVFSVYTLFPDLGAAIHHVFFTVSSIITTTGYATVDFNTWTPFAKTLVVLIMFIGACAGSTGGGIKVSRINVMVKGIKKELQMLLHPGLVKRVRMDGKPIAHETVRSINVFIAIYILTFVACLVLITLDGKDLVTSFTSVAATLNNIGPGLGEVGPMGSFAHYSDFSKYVLSFAMLAGRLELLPILLLLIPSMWRGTVKLTSRHLGKEEGGLIRFKARQRADSAKQGQNHQYASAAGKTQAPERSRVFWLVTSNINGSPAGSQSACRKGVKAVLFPIISKLCPSVCFLYIDRADGEYTVRRIVSSKGMRRKLPVELFRPLFKKNEGCLQGLKADGFFDAGKQNTIKTENDCINRMESLSVSSCGL